MYMHMLYIHIKYTCTYLCTYEFHVCIYYIGDIYVHILFTASFHIYNTYICLSMPQKWEAFENTMSLQHFE